MVGKIPKNHKILIVFPFSEKIFSTKKYTGHLNESRGLPHLFILHVGFEALVRSSKFNI
jgi:hypothetical protein